MVLIILYYLMMMAESAQNLMFMQFIRFGGTDKRIKTYYFSGYRGYNKSRSNIELV
jgi:hypothetical protein